MTDVSFRIYGKPIPKGSVRSVFRKAKSPTEHGRMLRFDSNRGTKPWSAAVKEQLQQKGYSEERGPVWGPGTPLLVLAHFFLPRPKKPKHVQRPAGKPDLDKLLRGIFDPMKGAIYADDAQVVAVVTTKAWASPGLEGVIVLVTDRVGDLSEYEGEAVGI